MLFLATDTSSTVGTLALLEQNAGVRCLEERQWQKSFSHSEQITEKLEEILETRHLDIKDIDAFIVGIGPGSFTGIRIAVNFIKSLAFLTNKPVYAVNSLQLLAQVNPQPLPILVINSAFRNFLYCARYHPNGVEVSSPEAVTTDIVPNLVSTPHLCLGDALEKYVGMWSQETIINLIPGSKDQIYISAQSFVMLLSRHQKNLKSIAWKNLNPLYIRLSEAEEKLRGGLLKPLSKFKQGALGGKEDADRN